MAIHLPDPRPCTICDSRDDRGGAVLITPRRGRIELSSATIDAAVYACQLCGAIRTEPLQQEQEPATPARLIAAA